jgi:drug/metabolite transporter (DMT)-like permease
MLAYRGNKKLIYFTLVIIMAIWGFNTNAVKVIVNTFAPTTTTAFRLFTAGIFVFIILGFLKKLRLPSKRELCYILAGGLFNVVGQHYYLSLGLKETSASNAGIIQGLGPLLTTVLAAIFLRSPLTLSRIFGIVLGFSGVGLVVLRNGDISTISIGDLYIFLSTLSIAISFIFISKIAGSLDPRLMTGYMFIIGSLELLIIGLITEPNGIKSLAEGSFGIWMLFLASAVIGTALSHMLYNLTISLIGAAEASIFINLSPLFTVIGAVIFLGEKIILSQISGFILIISGVIIGTGSWKELIKKGA